MWVFLQGCCQRLMHDKFTPRHSLISFLCIAAAAIGHAAETPAPTATATEPGTEVQAPQEPLTGPEEAAPGPPETAATEQSAPESAEPAIELPAPGPGTPALGLPQLMRPEPLTAAELQLEYSHYADIGSWEEAMKPAREHIQLLQEQFGDQAPELSEPLLDLGIAQHHIGDHVGAEQSYQRAIEIIQTDNGNLARELAGPTKGLGDVYYSAGAYELADRTYEHGKQLVRQNDGLYDIEQIEMIDAQTLASIALGDWEQADRRQHQAFSVAEHYYGPDNPQLLPSLSKLADWYYTDRRYAMARPLYKRAVEIIESNYGENSPELIAPLRAIAESYQREPNEILEIGVWRNREGRGRIFLNRAAELANASDDVSDLERALTTVALGDWYMVFNYQPDRGMEYYHEAIRMLQELPEGETEIQRLFGEPVQLHYQPPPDPYVEIQGGYVFVSQSARVQGTITVEYDVGPTGRVEDIRVVEVDPPGWIERRMMGSVADTRFRPRFVDGVPVRANGLRLEHEFDYPEQNNDLRNARDE